MNIVPLLLSLTVCAQVSDAMDEAAALRAFAEKRYAKSACVSCHRDQEGRLKEIYDEWAASVHYDNNVACVDCHGGDAELTHDQFATQKEFEKASHDTFSPEYRFVERHRGSGFDALPEGVASYACRECHSWSTRETSAQNPHVAEVPPDCTFLRFGGVAMSRERGIAYICASCHPESTEKQLASPHGNRGAPSCAYCHGNSNHAIPPATTEILDARPRGQQGRCALCHKPETMAAIAYIRETLDKTEKQIKVSRQQFEELREMGYRNLGLAEMQTHVVETRADLRQVQHGCNVGEITELAKSIENVAKRTAYDYELVQALREARQGQTEVAVVVAGLLVLLAAMLLYYKRAFCMSPEAPPAKVPQRRNMTPPCNSACPAGNDVQGFIAAAAKEDYDGALDVLLETTPFPSVCGRVCPAPCMDVCNREQFDESVNIRELERYVGDYGRTKAVATLTRDERIAVVGSGPAGLSASYQLVRLGYSVTLFERDEQLGGAMRTGLPTYRLPCDVLDREIDRILKCGVSVETGRAIERDDLLRLSHEYDAVFVATGLQLQRTIRLDAEAPDTVEQGIRFLEWARNGDADLAGKAIVVIGGGNVAIDVARTAIRLSAASVRLYCLELRNAMPAHAEEIEEATAEGVEINPGWGPVAVRDDGEGTRHVEFRRCLAVFDEHGMFAPTFDENKRCTVETDSVVLALGRTADLSLLPENSEVRDGEVLLGLTGAPILAGGDFAANMGTVSAAIGSGRRVALHIHRTLTGEDLTKPEGPTATPFDIKAQSFPHCTKARAPTLPLEMRRTGFAEVNVGLTPDDEHAAALAEAQRCFSCGVCNQCDQCMLRCPENVIQREGEGYKVDFAHCQSCGLCAAECPRGVIYMAEL
jgi:NADPH-dependent glutamate synthase beta subunit-like oxidoreductase